MNEQNSLNTDWEYAPFLKRLAAFLIDSMILSLAITGLGSLGIVDLTNVGNTPSPTTSGSYIAATIIISALYYTLLHSSKWQATIGKRFLGIKVATITGEQVTVFRAGIRYIVMEIFSSILYLGYFLMFFTKKKQTLHDLAAKTVVINA